MPRSKQIILSLLIFIAGVAVGAAVAVSFHSQEAVIQKISEKHATFQYVKPLLGFEVSDASSPQLEALQEKITAAVQMKINSKIVDDVGVYMRDLQTGQWIGVREDEQFHPASLLKVFILIAQLKRAESEGEFYLNRKLFYDGVVDLNKAERYPPKNSLEKGLYRIDELMSRMIVQSGNNSAELLRDDLGFEYFNSAYTNFPLSVPENFQDRDYMTPREYSILFRVLYNATFLSSKMSEKALELLAQTTFDKGLVAGLPKGTVVAHKFGEAENQLHDCGIVYTENPYFLCVMTKGESFPDLESAIAQISKLIYEYRQ